MPYPLCRRIRRNPFGMRPFNLLQLTVEQVILIIRNRRPVERIVEIAVIIELFFQLLKAFILLILYHAQTPFLFFFKGRVFSNNLAYPLGREGYFHLHTVPFTDDFKDGTATPDLMTHFIARLPRFRNGMSLR